MSENQEQYENHSVEQLDSEIASLEGKIAARGADPQKETKPEKPGLFEHGSDDKLTKEMGKVYDKSTAKDDFILGKKDLPSAKTDNFDSSFDSTYKWLNETPKAEQERMRDAHALVEQVRDNAKKFGVELTDQEAMARAMELEHIQSQEAKEAAADPWAPAAQEIQKFYPNEQPAAIAAEYAKLEGRFRSDPVAGFSEMANGIGVHPVRLAQEVIARYQHPQYQQYQNQQQQQNYQQEVARVTNLVEHQYQQFPRMAELEAEVLAELESAKRSGDPAKDLQAAYRRADAKNRKRSTSDKIDRSMNATYSRMQGRKI